MLLRFLFFVFLFFSCSCLAEEGGGTLRLEGGAEALVGGLEHAVGKREGELLVVELLDVRALGLSRLERLHLKDLDA